MANTHNKISEDVKFATADSIITQDFFGIQENYVIITGHNCLKGQGDIERGGEIIREW